MQMNAASAFHEITASMIFLMGSCFILGCLFTIFMLMLLDFMRRNVEKRKNPDGRNRQ